MHGHRYPIYSGKNIVIALDRDIYQIKMEGITHIVVKAEKTKKIFNAKKYDKEIFKQMALNIINKYNIETSNAIGVMFLEKINKKIKLHPTVWVKTIDTLFYETACASGTAAVAILKTIDKNSSQKLEVIQPSSKIITANTILKNGVLINAIISGKIKTDGKKRRLEI